MKTLKSILISWLVLAICVVINWFNPLLGLKTAKNGFYCTYGIFGTLHGVIDSMYTAKTMIFWPILIPEIILFACLGIIVSHNIYKIKNKKSLKLSLVTEQKDETDTK